MGCSSYRMDGTGGAEGAQAPPSFLDLYSKNFKISQIREEFYFFYLVVPPHKKFASVHPAHAFITSNHFVRSYEIVRTKWLIY